MITRVLALTFLLGASAAKAEAPRLSRPSWSGSLQVLGLASRAVGIELERRLGDDVTSLIASGAFRLPTGGDYAGAEWGLGVEARRFLWRPFASPQFEGTTAGGAFLLARIDGGVLTLRSDVRRSEASLDSLRYGFALGAGYRFLPGWRITLTPSAALGLSGHSQMSGRAAPAWSVRAQFGFSAGLLF